MKTINNSVGTRGSSSFWKLPFSKITYTILPREGEMAIKRISWWAKATEEEKRERIKKDNEKRKQTNLLKYGVENCFQSPEKKEKIKQTCMEKYGVEFPSQSKEIKQKQEETCLIHYGVKNPSQSEIIKNKKKKTSFDNYGVDFPSQSIEVQQQMRQACLEKHGTEYITQTENFKNKIKSKFLEKYGVKNPYQADEVKEKIKQTNLEKYGVLIPLQNEEVKKKFKATCLERYGVEYISQNKEIKEKMKNTWKIKSQDEKNKIIRKSKKTKLERYGDENYHNADKMMQTCLETNHNFNFSYRGNYQGFHYDSSWELSFIKYCIKNDIQIERNKKGFIYWFEDKKHKYYPDFYLPEVDLFIEIKGRIFDKDREKAKWNQFSYKLDVYNKEKLKPIIKEMEE
jgi:uncharacterized protein YjhX (UPF0386 family)